MLFGWFLKDVERLDSVERGEIVPVWSIDYTDMSLEIYNLLPTFPPG